MQVNDFEIYNKINITFKNDNKKEKYTLLKAWLTKRDMKKIRCNKSGE